MDYEQTTILKELRKGLDPKAWWWVKVFIASTVSVVCMYLHGYENIFNPGFSGLVTVMWMVISVAGFVPSFLVVMLLIVVPAIDIAIQLKKIRYSSNVRRDPTMIDRRYTLWEAFLSALDSTIKSYHKKSLFYPIPILIFIPAIRPFLLSLSPEVRDTLLFQAPVLLLALLFVVSAVVFLISFVVLLWKLPKVTFHKYYRENPGPRGPVRKLIDWFQRDGL